MLRFASKSYACSQIMALFTLGQCKHSNPGFIRGMSGLAYGCGGGTATCGVMTGACCVVGYFAGKGTDEEEGNEDLMLMVEELGDWFHDAFAAEHAGITCQAIVGDAGPQASRNICANILSETYSRTIKVLSDHGIHI
jgi:hypothetical protein